MKLLIFRLICKLRGHRYRRAHKDEDAGSKYCMRCGHGVAIRSRKPS